mgnify:CR=1 FL=1
MQTIYLDISKDIETVNPEIYDKVFDAVIDESNPSEIMSKINTDDHPLYMGKNITALDVISVEDKSYICQNEGFKDGFRTVIMKMLGDTTEVYTFSNGKLEYIEDDREVRNLIYNRLIMDASTPDSDLQLEVMTLFGERYYGMSIMDWQRIIKAYTPMIREASRIKEAQNYGMAAEREMDYNLDNN